MFGLFKGSLRALACFFLADPWDLQYYSLVFKEPEKSEKGGGLSAFRFGWKPRVPRQWYEAVAGVIQVSLWKLCTDTEWDISRLPYVHFTWSLELKSLMKGEALHGPQKYVVAWLYLQGKPVQQFILLHLWFYTIRATIHVLHFRPKSVKN